MNRRWRRLGIAAAGALALPAALALLSSGSCSLVELYDGTLDAAGGNGGASSSASSASSGPGGGDAGQDVIDAPSPCPADMVVIAFTAEAGYCVDKNEVTNAAYNKFLEADTASSLAPDATCGWNDSYAPAVPVDAGDSLPVLGVDWCDAYAYCRWNHRRLCGAVGGGAIASAQRDLNGSEWFRACSRGDSRVYPYGSTFNLTACADCNPAMGCHPDASPPTSAPAAVGTHKSCVGGYTGINDMSGNAAEWEDGCDDGGVRPDATDDAGKLIPDPSYDTCYHRGGSFYDNGASPQGQACLACSTSGCPPAGEARSHRPHNVGLRCCLDY